MQNPTAITTDPEQIVAIEIPANAKGVKGIRDIRSNRGNPMYYYAFPCVYVLADGRRFDDQLIVDRPKDLPLRVATVRRHIENGVCRAGFSDPDGRFLGCNFHFTGR